MNTIHDLTPEAMNDAITEALKVLGLDPKTPVLFVIYDPEKDIGEPVFTSDDIRDNLALACTAFNLSALDLSAQLGITEEMGFFVHADKAEELLPRMARWGEEEYAKRHGISHCACGGEIKELKFEEGRFACVACLSSFTQGDNDELVPTGEVLVFKDSDDPAVAPHEISGVATEMYPETPEVKEEPGPEQLADVEPLNDTSTCVCGGGLSRLEDWKDVFGCNSCERLYKVTYSGQLKEIVKEDLEAVSEPETPEEEGPGSPGDDEKPGVASAHSPQIEAEGKDGPAPEEIPEDNDEDDDQEEEKEQEEE